eukprot:6620884-Prymnesium_polylepis.1
MPGSSGQELCRQRCSTCCLIATLGCGLECGSPIRVSRPRVVDPDLQQVCPGMVVGWGQGKAG